jgi:hypothetical protein
MPLRWPLEEVRIVSESTEILSAVEHTSALIEALSNVRSAKVTKQPHCNVSVTINRAKVGAKFKKESPEALAVLEKAPAEEIAKWMAGDEKELVLEGKFAIERDMVAVLETASGFAIAPFEGGRVFVKTEMKKELYEEAMVREIARRVQLLRKERKLVEADRIELKVHCPEKELASIAKKHSGEICSQVNAESLELLEHMPKGAKEFEIGDIVLSIAIEKK